MATRFDSLELGDERLFGVRMHGAFGRGDRQRLLDLAARCLQRQKTRLVLECHDLDSLGGGGAGVLADLQRQLVAQGGEAVFVGAGEVIRRFLTKKFGDLPLRFFDDVPTAATALVAAADGPATGPIGAGTTTAPAMAGDAVQTADAPAPAPAEEDGPPGIDPPGTEPSATRAGEADLDRLLDDVTAAPSATDTSARRTADLVTAPYISLDDALAAVASGNTTLLGEALGVLLDSHDLAAETIFCLPRQQHYVAVDGDWRLPAEGGIVSALTRTGRPLTMLDLEDNDLWDEETELLEQLQPDIILPLVREETLAAVLLLQHAVTGHDYTLSEMFALELLQRVLADAGSAPAAAPTAAPGAHPERLDRDDGRPGHAVRVAVPAPASSGSETLLNIKLELARGLQEAQDVPHFWQVFISRLRLGVEVSSLVYLDHDAAVAPFLAGEARRGLGEADFASERIQTFFRTLERPVEIENMPASFRTERDALLERGLQWLVALRADEHDHLGVVALGLRWRCQAGEPTDEIHDLMEVTTEALMRLREGQRRADMSVGLLESLLVGAGSEAEPADAVTAGTVSAVRLLAGELGLPPDQLRDLVLGALLRNLGQQQPAPGDLEADRLTGAQWEVFRDHPGAGDQALAALNAPAAVRDAIRHHHERFDGRGFPAGLKGRDIPLAARLVAVAQHYALHLDRGDRDAALAAVNAEAGHALDPDLVQMFVKACRRAVQEPVTS